jgi:hypothetical protein
MARIALISCDVFRTPYEHQEQTGHAPNCICVSHFRTTSSRGCHHTPVISSRSLPALRLRLKPVIERERFAQLITHALKSAGCTHTLLADSGLELLRQASRGLPRQAGRIMRTAMQLAVPRGLNHLPDELLQQAIEEFR